MKNSVVSTTHTGRGRLRTKGSATLPFTSGTLARALVWAARSAPASALVLALSASGCATLAEGAASGGQGEAHGGSWVGRPAPELSFPDLSGKPLSLSSLRGQVVLLDVWASWCEPCKEELPLLDELAKKFRGQKVRVVAVSVDQERANVDQFLSRRPRWHLTLAHDGKGRVADVLSPDRMPTSYVIDPMGVVRHVNGGFRPGDERKIEGQIRALLK